MIRNLTTTTSPFLYVSNSSNSGPYISPGSQSSGMVRWNSSMHSMEVYDGNTWLQLGATADVALSPEANDLLMWARHKKQEELRIQSLIDEHPGVKDLKEKLDMMIALVNQEQE